MYVELIITQKTKLIITYIIREKHWDCAETNKAAYIYTISALETESEKINRRI